MTLIPGASEEVSELLDQADGGRLHLAVAMPGGSPLVPPPAGVPWLTVVMAGDDLPGGTPRKWRVAARLVHALIDVQRPRHIGGSAVKLLVKPIPQASDALSEDNAGCEGIGERGAVGEAAQAHVPHGRGVTTDATRGHGEHSLPLPRAGKGQV